MTYAGSHNLLNYPACQAHMHCENTTVNMKLKINLQIFKSLYFLLFCSRKKPVQTENSEKSSEVHLLKYPQSNNYRDQIGLIVT